MIELLHGPLSVDRCLSAVRHARGGGIVTFVGSVREISDGHQIDHLEYEAFEPMAIAKLEQAAAEACARWPVLAVAIQHRLGTLAVGDDAVVIAVSCSHRAEAFDACRYIIDRIKEIVPIWKKEFGENGAIWVGGPTSEGSYQGDLVSD